MSDWKLPRRQRRYEARLRGLPYRSSVSNQPHYVKMYFITQFLPDSTREAVYPMRALQLAAVEIQRTARGFGLRKRFKNIKWNSMSQREKTKKARSLSRPPLLKIPTPNSTSNSMLSKYLQYVRVREKARIELAPFAGGGFAVWCAAKIQAWWRMLKEKWHFTLLRYRMYHIASQQIQFMAKSFLSIGKEEEEEIRKKQNSNSRQKAKRERVPKFNSIRDDAAYKIQAMWWRHANKRVYRYFRDLIQFRLCGNPASLLRTINPREASLFDKATGIHIRFRLGGKTFPPTLYYKVFLLNPLCDVGSFAPRNYAYANKSIQEHERKYQNNKFMNTLNDTNSNSITRRRRNGNSNNFNQSSSNGLMRVSSPLSTQTTDQLDDYMSGESGGFNNTGQSNQRNITSLQMSGSNVNGGNLNRSAPLPGRYYEKQLRQPFPHSRSEVSKVDNGNSSIISSSQHKKQQQQPSYDETKQQQSSLGQIRVGSSYFGTKIDNVGPEGTTNWYKRVENNGWRPVTGQKAHEAAGQGTPDAPHGAYDNEDNTSYQSMAFHYSRLKRKEDKEKIRKTKKLDWLKHMYQEGLAKTREDDQDEDQDKGKGNINNNRRNPLDKRKPVPNNDQGNNNYHSNYQNQQTKVKTTGNGGGGRGYMSGNDIDFSNLDLDNDEDEELLTWSKNLDFDHYVANWHVLATSGTSGNNYHVPTNKSNTREMVPEPDWIALKKQFA
mmetsp:Transcript_32216/g.37854  ORF Transcript_32216/g.37854 Transcript_32216/m.37854 type:complete len:719 (+) Transcript_32216:56-2212(+)